MKKLALILAALMLGTSVVLSSCGDVEKTSDKTKDEQKQEEVKDSEKEENKDEASENKDENAEESTDDGENAESEEEFDLYAHEDVQNFFANEVPSNDAAELTAYNAAFEDKLASYVPKEALDEEVLLTINNLPVSAATVRYANMACKSAYEGTDTPQEDIDKEIDAFYRINAALLSLAQAKGIEFTEDEYASNVEGMIQGYKLQSGDSYADMFKDTPYTEYFFYLYQTIYVNLFNKLTDVYLEEEDTDFTKAVRSATLEYLNHSDYVRAKHILIQFPEGEGENGEVTDEQKAATLKEANAVLEKVNSMGDISEFDALIEEYNDDPGMTSNPNGYYFGRGEMVAEFENAAYELNEGETSGLVETSYGYHILLKLPLDDEALSSSEIYSTVASSIINELLFKIGESYDLIRADNHDERVSDFYVEYDEIMARLETAE